MKHPDTFHRTNCVLRRGLTVFGIKEHNFSQLLNEAIYLCIYILTSMSMYHCAFNFQEGLWGLCAGEEENTFIAHMR